MQNPTADGKKRRAAAESAAPPTLMTLQEVTDYLCVIRKRFSAASELLDRKLRTKKRSKSAKRFSQSKQDFIMDRCLLFSVSLSNWSI